MIKVRIYNQVKTKANKVFLNRVARAVLGVLKIKNAALNLIFVDENTIGLLNAIYRNKNKPTDVLSFENKEVKNFVEIKKAEEKYFIGEVFICFSVAKKQARQKDFPIFKELTVLFTHGILHLVGYDHEKSKKDAIFTKKIEEKILNSVF